MAKQLGVKRKIYSPVYRPRANGCIEGFHKFLKECISKHMVNNLEWDNILPLAAAAYNWFPNEHSKEPAFFLMFGRDAATNFVKLIKPKQRYLGDVKGLLKIKQLQKLPNHSVQPIEGKGALHKGSNPKAHSPTSVKHRRCCPSERSCKRIVQTWIQGLLSHQRTGKC